MDRRRSPPYIILADRALGGYHRAMGDDRSDAVARAYRRTTWGNTMSTVEEWRRILADDDEEQKRRLFEHVFFESPDGSDVRALFSPDEIRAHVGRLTRPVPRAHLERRRKVWRRLYCGVCEPIPELDWRPASPPAEEHPGETE